MSSLQQSSRFIPFTNSAQRSQLLPGQGTFPQSLSGSETDVSTSNENLSHEERYVIKHTARQEPQGQENLSSNRSSLDVSSSSYNTLIIHGAGDESWTGRLSGIRDMQDGNGQNYLSSHSYSASPTVETNKKMGSHSHSPSPSLSLGSNKEGRIYDPSVREITDIPDDYLSQSQVLKHLAKEVKVVPCGTEGSSGIRESAAGDDEEEEEESKRGDSCDRPERLSAGRELTPRPPPEYPKWLDSPVSYRLRGTGAGPTGTLADKINLSRSQPDLSRIGASKIGSPRPKTNGREDVRRDVWPPAEMVEILIQENSSLKLELETCYQKVAKSQKLEQEIAKVHRAHEELVQGSERRERLERAARTKLQTEVRRLQEANRALREQAELLSAQLLTGPRVSVAAAAEHSVDSRLREELNRREILVAQLITQNKELAAAKERQEIELAAQRATLQEQRTHIDILDTALTNAQANVVRLEEECRKKQVYVERVAQLQRALSSLQLASERREQTERKLRQQLEQELRSERGGGGEGAGSGNGADNKSGESAGNGVPSSSEVIAELKRQLRERDDRLVRLEGEVAKWEQRYLEESALRQAAIDAASIPKDAKIAALEKTSQETEKLIAEARSEKIRHMDEVHAAQKKVADLESRLKDLESKLAERDAMIRVLQKHTYDKDVSSFPSMLVCSPHHTPHPSLHGNSDLGVLGTSVSREELDPVSTTSVFSTVSGASCSTGISSYTGSCSDSAGSKLSSYHRPLTSSYAATRTKYGSVAANKSFDETNKSLDDQLKELDSQLDSQLLSKRGLCCFPGFSNTGTTPRKGKLPKPLLAGVGRTGSPHHLFEPSGFLQGLVPTRYEQGRPEEILLLEKQGRSSQQQRAASLPPTSLPRPPRRPPAGSGAGYGRLGDGSASGSESHGPVPPSPPPAPAATPPPSASHRSGIPRKLGGYGRLAEGSVETPSRQRKSSIPCSVSGSVSRSVHSNGQPSSSGVAGAEGAKLRLFTGPRSRRSSSVAKPASTDSSNASSKSVASTGKYRIQF
ncbi:angiomotin-like protein 2 [Schistocerca nitens]|uniref:angiomotin-like protein 2 n=1 Tax=Schistocerca nitens TaxID=7011 RepID=UPI0021186AAF|nr:angiomotin-like protein 2 [Schistocerca nitens]XP_049803935.1 angiomotin-like protein 2 [Schistocerca nitens]